MNTSSGARGKAQSVPHLHRDGSMTNHCLRPMNAPCKAIRIIDLDVGLTQPSDEATGFRRLYLKLSHEPLPGWVHIFEQERRFTQHKIWRKAWIVGAHIVVECAPEELEHFQLNHLKKDVAETNRKFALWAASTHADTMRRGRERAKAQNDLERLRQKLNFD